VPPAIPEHIKRLTLVACVLGTSIALLDATIVNVALPAIQRSLHGGLSTQQWVVDSYALTLGALILVGGSLGDVFGEKRVFAIGVVGFGITSLGCAVAPTSGVLIGMRAIQGVAGALLTPAALAVITTTFSPEERGAAVGTWTAWGAIATIIGPLAGGALVSVASWRWVFLVNLPLVAVTLFLILRFVPGAAHDRSRHVDVLGAVLAALGLGGPVFALIEQPRLGWTSPAVLGSLIGGVFLLGAFLVRERSAGDPMLPLRLFARRNFAVANAETLVMYAGLSVLFFLLALFLQEVVGWTATQAGLATLPTTLVMFVLSKRVGRLADQRGPRLFLGVGPLLAAVGLLLFLRVGRHVNVVGDLLPALLVFALGLSLTVAPLTATVLAGVQAGEAGIASAVNNATARVAGLVGVAALGPVIGSHLSVSTFHTSLAAAAVLLAVAGILGATLIRNPTRTVRAEECAGGQIAGVARDAVGCREQRAPARTPAWRPREKARPVL
jgi:EmrB/QacA subfamily drug resistance transporter